MKMLQETPNGKVMPDADVEWIIDNLETPLLMKLREPQQQAYLNGQSAVPPGQGGMPGPAGMPQPGSVPGPGAPPGGPQIDPRVLAALQASQGGGPGGAPPGAVNPGVPGVSTMPSVPAQGMGELQRMLQPS